MTVYNDLMTFVLDCRRVLLKDPRLTPDLRSRNLAFSSYFILLSAIFSLERSIKSVSNCVLVKVLFFLSICAMGSSKEALSHFCTSFLRLMIRSPAGGLGRIQICRRRTDYGMGREPYKY